MKSATTVAEPVVAHPAPTRNMAIPPGGQRCGSEMKAYRLLGALSSIRHPVE
jgi:hypothetical protein